MKNLAFTAGKAFSCFLVFLGVISTNFAAAADGAAELMQARNGTPTEPTDPVDWTKGNAGPSNSHYVEGFSVPYRVVIRGVTPGPHYLVLEWDTLRAGKHALDYLTHYNRLTPHTQFGSHTQPETIQPLDGLSGPFASPTTIAIPTPSSVGSPLAGQPSAQFEALPPEQRALTLWNGTATNVTYVSQEPLTNDSAASRLRIDFIATDSTVVIAFGARIASRFDWGFGNSASSISGSPYHMRMVSFDGSGGSQDCSLSALAVLVPPTCLISGPESVCALGTNVFTATTDANSGVRYQWSFNGNTAGAVIIGPADGPSVQVRAGEAGDYTIQLVVASSGGSSTCSRQVTLRPLPVLTPPAGFTVERFIDVPPPAPETVVTSGGFGDIVVRHDGDSAQTNGFAILITRRYVGTDACGNTAEGNQRILVSDTTAPTLVCPTNIVASCGGSGGTPVLFVVTATDSGDPTPRVISFPVSGSLFPLGVTTVTNIATDASGNRSECTFTVTIVDAVPPVITCPRDFAVVETAPRAGSAIVTYANVEATDNCDDGPLVMCEPPSGSVFPLGRTVVTCTARDSVGNTSSCSFTVQVVPITIEASNLADSGPGSLRQALIDANAAPGTNTIEFNFPGPGPFVIHLLTPLPPIVDPIIVDGASQPGFTLEPIVEVNGSEIIVNDPLPGPEPGVAVGLTLASAGNVVRGLVLNGFAVGLRVEGPGGNLIQGNRIGMDDAGVMPGNRIAGIQLRSPNNLVGGVRPGDRNIIGGNGGDGIQIETIRATNNVVVGNFIGVAGDGFSPLGNAGAGVWIGNGAAKNRIGGNAQGEDNVIAFNGGPGVALNALAGAGNAIRGNRIMANLGLGIDLGEDGATPNDPGDADAGPNDFQNAPVITAAITDGTTLTIAGRLNSTPDTFHQIEFFLNASNTVVVLGRTAVLTDAKGDAEFHVTFRVPALATQFVSATATREDGSTSELAAFVQVSSPPIILVQPVDLLVALGETATFCSTAIGTEPLFYQWRLNGANVPGATNACLTVPGVELTNGGTYTVIVANDLGIVLSDPALLAFTNSPAGDNFADRIALSQANGVRTGRNTFATQEPGEPMHVGKPGGKSIWYTWTAPSMGIATFSTAGSTFDTLLAIYTGASLQTLIPYAGDEDSGGFYTSAVRFNVEAGSVYQIAVDGFAGASGDTVLSWMLEVTSDSLPIITNQPISRTVGPAGTATFFVGAIGVCREIEHDCRPAKDDDKPPHPNPQLRLDYQWFFNGVAIPGATESTLVITNVGDANAGNYIAQVSNGARGILTRPAALQINQTDNFVQEVLAWDKFYDSVYSAPIRLGTPGAAPAGADGFQPASTVVRGYTGTQVFNTAGSSTEAGEEPICGVVGGASQWISFVAEESGFAFLNTDGSSYDTVIAVFARATTGPTLVQLDCDNNGGLDTRDSALVVPVQGGRTNFIVIDGVNGATGILRLNYSLVTPTRVMPLGVSAEGFSRVRVSGRPNLRFTLQRSTGLQQGWSSILTTNAPSGVFDFTDRNSATLSGRFYRALLLP